MTARGDIWVLGDLRSGRLFRDSLNVLAKALPLAQATGNAVKMILLGDTRQPAADGCEALDLAGAARQAAARGAGSVLVLNHPDLAVVRTDLYAQVLADIAARRKPWLVLMALNDFNRETAAFCAQHCRAGMIADCAELAFEQNRVVGRCPAWGGQILADITLADGWPMAFVTVQPHGAPTPPEPASPAQVETLDLPSLTLPENPLLLKREMATADQHRLEDAAKVVVGGAGLGDLRGFGMARDLAGALGAEIAATRPPVLLHWVDEERLIGQTGKTVRPELLITIGTSGAVQYTAGIRESGTIVAVDRDPKAPIFQVADLGIVADAKLVLPLVTQRVQQITMRRLTDAACSLGEAAAPARGGFGALIRQLRAARDWSVEELAQRTGQTPDFITQVEEERLSPPVAFILGMAQAMQVDPGTFLRREEQSALRDRRAQAYYRRTQEYSYTTLTPEAQNSHLRAFMVTIEPHHAHKPVAYKHEGEEFIFVLEGDLELNLDAAAHLLKPGESIHFNSDVPHKLKSLSNTPTRCLVVLYTI